MADLTPAYAKHAGRVERGRGPARPPLGAGPGRDDGAKGRDVWWFMHTPATVTLAADGRRAVLEQGKARGWWRGCWRAGRRRILRFALPAAPSSPHPSGQNANEGFRKLAIHLPHVESLRLAVLFTPEERTARPDQSEAYGTQGRPRKRRQSRTAEVVAEQSRAGPAEVTRCDGNRRSNRRRCVRGMLTQPRTASSGCARKATYLDTWQRYH